MTPHTSLSVVSVVAAAASSVGVYWQSSQIAVLQSRVKVLERSDAIERRSRDLRDTTADPFRRTPDGKDWETTDDSSLFLFRKGIVIGHKNTDCDYGDFTLSVDPGKRPYSMGRNCPSGTGAVTFGLANKASAQYSSVLGGSENTASGLGSSVSGGSNSETIGTFSSVSGGYQNYAADHSSSVSGGSSNRATGARSSISGGNLNAASGTNSAIMGGYYNLARGSHSSILGGESNVAIKPTMGGWCTSILGGYQNHASENWSSVSGGHRNVASGTYASVLGGYGNVASEKGTSVLGGNKNEANETWAMVPSKSTLSEESKDRIALLEKNSPFTCKKKSCKSKKGLIVKGFLKVQGEFCAPTQCPVR